MRIVTRIEYEYLFMLWDTTELKVPASYAYTYIYDEGATHDTVYGTSTIVPGIRLVDSEYNRSRMLLEYWSTGVLY